MTGQRARIWQDAARHGPYFTVGTGRGELSLQSLYRGGADLVQLISDTAAAVGVSELRVAASTWHLAACAYLWSPVLACGQTVPIVDPAQTYWMAGQVPRLRTQGWHLGTLADLRSTHFAPLNHAVERVAGVPAALLWGNVASAAVGALRVMGCGERIESILALPWLAGTMRAGVRRSCCLFYRTPTGGYCGDCPIPDRAAG